MTGLVRLLAIGAILSLTPGLSRAVSLYDYYAPGGQISSGLVAEGPTLTLNNQDLLILSGSFHYFRVHPDYWRDTFRKMRAAGLNTVQTYVAWNLHEPRQGVYDFGTLDEEMSVFLDIRTFILMAKEEDLFVVLRPGPYICSEWEFGGLPSWLLRDPAMAVRSSYPGYQSAAEAFFRQLFAQIADLQFANTGGPIIAVQIENEFGSFGYTDWPRDRFHLEFLNETFSNLGFSETLFFISDNPTSHYDWGSFPGVFQTANFQTGAAANFDMLKKLQPNRPLMVAEFWTGWFDYWLSGQHSTWSVDELAIEYEYIISQNSSVNLYMFIGGTNFGYMAGAEVDYVALVTSYDYDAPLTEAGDYTEKYYKIQEILSRLNPLNGIVDNPAAPDVNPKMAYGNFKITDVIDFQTILNQVPVPSETSFNGPVNMENLNINDGNGQSYGYLLYTTQAPIASPQSTLLIRGHVRDLAQLMVDGVLVTSPYGNGVDENSFGFWQQRDRSMAIDGTGEVARLDFLVENLGRVNFGEPHVYDQRKGLWQGPILVDENVIYNWTMTPLEFKKDFVNGLTGWTPFTETMSLPSLYRATIVTSPAQDTFLDMRAWNKGVVFLNGFNLGRYWSVGPQQTLYVPAPLLRDGANEIVIFEQYAAATEIIFIDYPILG